MPVILRQLPHEFHRPLNPARQMAVVLDAFRLDQHPALHRPAGDVELPDVRLPQRRLPFVGAEPGDERVLPDPRLDDIGNGQWRFSKNFGF